MKIGIIVHSQTGNTHSVAQRLQESFSKSGHEVFIERLEVVGGERPSSPFQIASYPDPGKYDVLIFGAPVRAFSISPVIAAYLKQLPSLAGKRVLCYVTMSFPFAWMGGKNAITKMKEACESKAGLVNGTEIISWSPNRREGAIANTLEQFCRLLQS